MTCPGEIVSATGSDIVRECSGHGVCNLIKRLANHDNENDYILWDRGSLSGCECDVGYAGGDCSQRLCGYGIDPLYFDDVSALKYAAFNFAILAASPTVDIMSDESSRLQGMWDLLVYDNMGEDWRISSLPVGISCEMLLARIEDIPGSVIPKGSISCYRTDVIGKSPLEGIYHGDWNLTMDTPYRKYSLGVDGNFPRTEYYIYRPALWGAGFANSYEPPSPSDALLSGYVYRLAFTGVPGYLKEPIISRYSDGATRPTLHSPSGDVFTSTWTDGEQGEFTDYIADHCKGVVVNVMHDNNGNWYLSRFTSLAEESLLKQCLGDADGNPESSVGDVFNWDYGDVFHPHLIKLVPSQGDMRQHSGFYSVIFYDTSFHIYVGGITTQGTFMLLNPMRPLTFVKETEFDVYVTSGTLSLTSSKAEVLFDFASNILYTININFDVSGISDIFNGDISCDNWSEESQDVFTCIEKNDLIMFFSFEKPAHNPPFLNMYTVNKIFSLPETRYVGDNDPMVNPSTGIRAASASSFRIHQIITDLSTNWAHDIDETTQFRIYKFSPSILSSYEYVAPCSNRGVCDYEDGLCYCHSGYSGAYCTEQVTISL